MISIEPIMEKLKYISKSKMNLYNFCPFSFKLHYLDKKKRDYCPYMAKGSQVHDFIDNFFDKVKVENNKLIIPDVELKHRNYYIKNFILFQIQRWEGCLQQHPENPEKYFFPILKEELIKTENPALIGIVDWLYWTVDNQLAVIEIKTGKPTIKKIKKYEQELVWYKLLLEVQGKFSPINKRIIYFPYNNFVHTSAINGVEVKELEEKIDKVRERILSYQFPANTNKCKQCGYWRHCPNFKRW